MKESFISLLSSTLFLLGALSGFAEIVPSSGSESIPNLYSAATSAFRGEVILVRKESVARRELNGKSLIVGQYIAEVKVDHVYKGALSNRVAVVEFERPEGDYCSVSRCVSIPANAYSLFFVKEIAGHYTLVDSVFGRFTISRLTASTPSLGLRGIEDDLVAGLGDSREQAVLTSLELLGSMRQVNSTEAIRTRLEYSSVLIRAAALTSLLHRGDYKSLTEAQRIALSSDTDPRLTQLQDRMSLYISEIKDIDTVPDLITLARSPSDWLREAAIHALRGLHPAKAVPTFISALDDPVKLIRYDAVLGLAACEENWDLAPSVARFDELEPKYISEWKSWWQQVGRAKYGY